MKALCLALVLLTGCSWRLVSGPDGSRTRPRCTTSMVWPVVDGAFTALFLTIAVTAITNPRENRTESSPSQANEVATATGIAALWAISGVVGYRRISRCEDAREQFEKYPNGPPLLAPTYGTSTGFAPPVEVPYSGPTATQPQPTQPQPQPAQPQTAPAALGTEGDVCASTAECSTGLTCTNNVCIRPPAKR